VAFRSLGEPDRVIQRILLHQNKSRSPPRKGEVEKSHFSAGADSGHEGTLEALLETGSPRIDSVNDTLLILKWAGGERGILDLQLILLYL